MKTATAQARLFDPGDATVQGPATDAAAAVAPSALDDWLLPPTKVQVFYWAQLCGELSKGGTAGIADADGWPADLRPTAATLKALVERGLIARRDRAWKLRRHWYARLTALKARAVNTPPLTLAERPAPHLPTYGELEQWEAVCRWLDVQPGCRARLPFVGLAPLLRREDIGLPESSMGTVVLWKTVAPGQVLLSALLHILSSQEEAERAAEEHATLLHGMRKYRVVRHTKGCAWVLSSTWREKLRALHAGIDRALRDYAPPQLQPASARSLCAGLDTWGLNWLVEEKALPAHLRAHLDDLQHQAHEVEGEVQTPWLYDGVPLRMYQAGVRAKGGKGVSWSYILVNPSLRLLIRRTPLGGIIASARLGSDCLWRRTPRAALDELDALIHRLWGRDKGRWQVSYAHLAHDVANAPLEREQLDRYVSRSRRRAVYEAATAEVERLLRESRPREAAGAHLDWEAMPVDEWEAEFADDEEELLFTDAFAEDGYEWDVVPHGVQQAREALEGEVEQRSMTAFGWGKRLSGVAFSPGGAVSFVMYRKDWEGRLKGKRHMEPLWKAAGWDGKEPVTRHEARLVREPIRELRAAAGDTGERGTEPAAGDDPWVFLNQVPGVWARMVGRADGAPDAVDVAWIRRVVPREGESNRSRWDTDPVWRVVQEARFTPAPLSARRLVRRQQREHDVQRLNLQLLGVLEKREAVLHADPEGRDVSLALRDVLVPLERELAAKGEQFDAAVRRKRQQCGLPVPLSARVLPLRPRQGAEEAAAEQEHVMTLERDLEATWAAETAEAGGDLWAEQHPVSGEGTAGTSDRGEDAIPLLSLRARSAELRMRQAYAALEAAELCGAAAEELTELEAAYSQAVSAYEASLR